VAWVLAATLPVSGQVVSISGGLPSLESTPVPSGTGLVIGRVVEGDSTKPVPGVVVSVYLLGASVSYDPAITDDLGRFVLRDLPKGNFSFRTQKPGWQYGAYGKRYPTGPDEAGQPLTLGDDERIGDVVIRMWKFAAITGTVTDETGDPIVNVSVRALPRKIIAGRSMFSFELISGFTATTDDRGVFRLSQLPPGDYIVAVPVVSASTPKSRASATPPPGDLSASSLSSWLGGSRGLADTTIDVGDDSYLLIDWIRAGSLLGATPMATPSADGRLLAYETQFYPATTAMSRATTVTLGSGDELTGVDFRMRPAATSRVSGTVTGPDGPAANLAIRLVSADMSGASSDAEVGQTITEPDGRFTFLGVVPGSYVVKAFRALRPIRAPADLMSTRVVTSSASGGTIIMSGGGSDPIPNDPAYWAEANVSVGDRDVVDVAIRLQEGFRVRGHVEFEGSSQRPTGRLATASIERADGQRSVYVSTSLVTVDAEGRFGSFGQAPGRYLLRASAGSGWNFVGAMLGDRDLSVTPFDLTAGHIDDVVLKFTDKPLPSISGTVNTATGQPDPSATVFLFPADRQLWSSSGASPRNFRAVGSLKSGRYSITNLPPGDYFVAASAAAPGAWADPKNLEAMAATAIRVSVAAAEQKVQDLRLAGRAPDMYDPEPREHGPYVADERQTPARDAPAVALDGTATISGVITADDQAHTPMSRVHVSLTTGTAGLGTRVVITDATGRFTFPRLPAGRYSLSANKPAYLTTAYGAKRPGGVGTTISLTDGQQLTGLTLTVSKGGVVTGTIRDERGQPMSGVNVQVMQYRTMPAGERRLQSMGPPLGPGTDDRGVYRLFGLAPGEYYVAASIRNMSSSAHQTTAADVQSAQRALQPNAAGPSGVARAGTPATAVSERPATVRYAPVFYPGTSDASQARTVKVAAGEERAGVDFALMLVPTVRVSGSVSNSTGPLPSNVEVRLLSVGEGPPAGLDIISILPTRPTTDGKFTFNGIAPGQYVAAASTTAPAGGRGAPPGAGPMLWATTDVSVNGVDISNVRLTLQPGMTVSGKIVFAATTLQPPADLTTVRLAFSPVVTSGQVSISQGNTAVAADGSFSIAGVMPGRYTLRATAAAADARAGWFMKSVTAGGRDISDDSLEVRPGENTTDAVISFSDRPTELSGTLQDAGGRPAPDYFVILFPSDKTLWRGGTRRIPPIARPSSNGLFRFANVLPGDYFLAALTDYESGQQYDPAFLAQLVGSAIKLTLADGEKKVQDIRITK